MTAELLSVTLKDLFVHSIPQMDSEQPKKIKGEAQRIYEFGFESFQAGFLYGMSAGIGTAEELRKEDKND